LFQKLGIATTEFAAVADRDALDRAVNKIGLPAVLKTCRMGYDGKGQWILRKPEDVAGGEKMNCRRLIPPRGITAAPKVRNESAPFLLERLVPFTRELSILAVRGRTGETAVYPLVENHHRDGILRLSLAPAPQLDRTLQHAAEEAARRVCDALRYVGVLAIEFFSSTKGACWLTKWRRASTIRSLDYQKARSPANSKITCAPWSACPWARRARWAARLCSI